MTERKIAFYDIDRTSYQGLLIKDLIKYQLTTGTLSKETFDAINNEEELYKRGKLYEDMAQDMLVHLAKGLTGKKISELEEETSRFFKTPEGNKFFSFVGESIQMLKLTHDTYFITAEPQYVAKEVLRIHGATDFISTLFEITENGVITGRISVSLAKKENKGIRVRQLMLTHAHEHSFAFGDSDGDIEMLEEVENPVCINPNDELKKKATEKNWEIKKPEEVLLFVKSKLPKTDCL